MGKISNYARVLVAKLQDVFVIDTTDGGVTTTKSVTLEKIGDAICGTQVHSDLKTDDQTIIGGINELAKDKNIADEYDDTATYNKGDVTIYGNTLYICNTNNITGTFDPSKWTATTVQSLIGSLSTLTTSDKSSLVGAVNELDSGKLDKTTYTENTSVTINNTVATGAVYTKKIGNMVMVWGLVTTTANITTGTAILSGMFMNNNGANNVVKFIDNNGTSPDWILYTPNANNVLLSAGAQSSGHSYTVSFIYYSA